MSSNTTSKADTKSKMDSQSQENSRSQTNSKSQVNSKSQSNSRNQLSSKRKEWEGEGADEEEEDELELDDLVDKSRAQASELLLDDEIYDGVGGEEGDFVADSSHQSGLMIDDEDEAEEGEEDEEGEGEDDADDADLDGIRFSELELSESNDDQGDAPKSGKKVLSSDAESSPSSDNESDIENPEIPAEYWQVQRLIKYVKAGNPTATIIAMSSLRDFNLRDYYVQIAIKEAGGLEVLLNILETDENRCKIAALLVLREISSNPEISRNIYNMRVCYLYVCFLGESFVSGKCVMNFY